MGSPRPSWKARADVHHQLETCLRSPLPFPPAKFVHGHSSKLFGADTVFLLYVCAYHSRGHD